MYEGGRDVPGDPLRSILPDWLQARAAGSGPAAPGSSGDSVPVFRSAPVEFVRLRTDSGEGGECLELAACPHTIHVRDSKNPTGPALALSGAAWAHFLPYGSGSGSSPSTGGAATAVS
ncbi:DUF397 domain-containing protein [Streptomyces bobili]|uniref:DUF397 domain-containing protein n=1 Tax=Streptomyces bobili TaxID=67280 RepID=UPI0037014CB8